jgi:hypothetical protein
MNMESTPTPTANPPHVFLLDFQVLIYLWAALKALYRHEFATGLPNARPMLLSSQRQYHGPYQDESTADVMLPSEALSKHQGRKDDCKHDTEFIDWGYAGCLAELQRFRAQLKSRTTVVRSAVARLESTSATPTLANTAVIPAKKADSKAQEIQFMQCSLMHPNGEVNGFGHQALSCGIDSFPGCRLQGRKEGRSLPPSL